MIANLMYGDQYSLDCCEYWRNAQYLAETVGFELRVGPFKNELVGKYECHARHWLSWLVNGLMRSVLLNLITIQIAQSPDALDFVLNVVAAAVFIIEFDNYNMWGVDPQEEIRMVDQAPQPGQAPQLVGQAPQLVGQAPQPEPEPALQPDPIPEPLEPGHARPALTPKQFFRLFRTF